MKFESSVQIFEKHSNIKFHENPSSGSRVVTRGRTGGRWDMKTLTVACSNFAIVPKNTCSFAKMLHTESETRKGIKNRLNYMMNMCLCRS
jgi:hypothetical protein